MAIVLVLGACVPPPVLDLSRPVDPSLPVVELDVQPLLEGTGVRVGLGVWHPSLQFAASNGVWTARYDVVLRAWKRDGRRLAAEQSAEQTVTVSTFDATTTLQSDALALALDLKPGTYWVTATVRDLNARTESVTGAVATVRAVEVVAPYRVDVLTGTPPTPAYSRTLLADGELVHLRVRTAKQAAYTVSVAYAPLVPRPALPPCAPRAADEPLVWTGVARQQGALGTEGVGLELGVLQEGVYRWQVEAEGRVWQTDTWVVRDATFPVVTQWSEMVAALSYIATPDEVEALRAVAPGQRRTRFDAFWRAGQRSRAASTQAVQRFAERLEAANLRFSHTRSGWQTDRGMLYTVLGSPFFIDRDYNLEIWQYRLDAASDRVTAFVFTRNAATGRWHLRRDPSYKTPWDTAVRRWRTGSVGP